VLGNRRSSLNQLDCNDAPVSVSSPSMGPAPSNHAPAHSSSAEGATFHCASCSVSFPTKHQRDAHRLGVHQAEVKLEVEDSAGTDTTCGLTRALSGLKGHSPAGWFISCRQAGTSSATRTVDSPARRRLAVTLHLARTAFGLTSRTASVACAMVSDWTGCRQRRGRQRRVRRPGTCDGPRTDSRSLTASSARRRLPCRPPPAAFAR
jgi:hypothetical protein